MNDLAALVGLEAPTSKSPDLGWKPTDHSNSFVVYADWSLGTPHCIAFIRKTGRNWYWSAIGLDCGERETFGEAQRDAERAVRKGKPK